MRSARAASLAGAILAVAAACAPPLEPAARHYVVFESLQFGLLALVAPALLVLGVPLERITIQRPGRLAALVARQVEQRRRFPGFLRAMPALIGYLVALGFWQLPGVVDALRVTPALVAAEVGTFAIIGVAYWSEIVTISPLAPRTSGPGLVALAVLPMWTVWVIAYFIGFSHNGWFPAYGHAGAMISAVADEQFATGTLWALSAATFLPVVFANLLRVLSNDVDESGGSHLLGGPARQARG